MNKFPALWHRCENRASETSEHIHSSTYRLQIWLCWGSGSICLIPFFAFLLSLGIVQVHSMLSMCECKYALWLHFRLWYEDWVHSMEAHNNVYVSVYENQKCIKWSESIENWRQFSFDVGYKNECFAHQSLGQKFGCQCCYCWDMNHNVSVKVNFSPLSHHSFYRTFIKYSSNRD